MNSSHYQNEINQPWVVCGQCGQKCMSGERFCTMCGNALAPSTLGEGASDRIGTGWGAEPALVPADNDWQDYLVKAPGTNRTAINVMCGVGLLVFGWLVAVPFLLMGKRLFGWLYIISVLILFRVAIRVDEVWLVYFLVYIIAWVHANLAFSHYQRLAQLRRPMIEPRAGYDINAALEMGVLYKKALGQTWGAVDILSKALTMPGGDPALLNQAGLVMYSSKRYYEAVEFFRRALDSCSDSKLQAAIRKNFVKASRKLQKVQARTGGVQMPPQ